MNAKKILRFVLAFSVGMFLFSGCYSMKLINNYSNKTESNNQACVKSQAADANMGLADAR